ncbi:MAG TPA: hypothetical protein PLW01_09345 [Agitococcus sp.]|uniref:hypothetical protein n=1 Tax=uncultured Agitococcus sp. TaxID=1506599 RepID=UPI0026199581|nr:hypothetical protein [uncultured Agitococcus sp.]HRH92108.1 hypothetical protein [Agitococcus sp.]
MSYSVASNFYLIDNYLFDTELLPKDYLLKTNKRTERRYGYAHDFCIFSYYGRSLYHTYSNILPRSPSPNKLLTFLICDAVYESQYFIIKPSELYELVNELNILVNWMSTDNYCLTELLYFLSDNDIKAILEGNYAKELNHSEFIYYAFYCLIDLKNMALKAIENNQFFVIKIYVS